MKLIIASIFLLSNAFFMASEKFSHFPSTSSDESTTSEFLKEQKELRHRRQNNRRKLFDAATNTTHFQDKATNTIQREPADECYYCGCCMMATVVVYSLTMHVMGYPVREDQ